MQPTAHPEVFARDWLPPVVVGRSRQVAEIVHRLEVSAPGGPGPWFVAVTGPSGSGTSTVARRAAREVVDRLRATSSGPLPRVLAVRTVLQRGVHGVVTALVQRMQDGFDGRGFPAPEILAGLLRRLRREGRPTVLVLDDIATGGPELGPILRAVLEPARFLPEGEDGLPPLYVVLAGTPEAMETLQREVRSRIPLGPFVPVSPYSAAELSTIVADRAQRALGHALPTAVLDRLVIRCVEEGGGARRAVDLLRRELLGVTVREMRGGEPCDRLRGIWVEPWVVRAIGDASLGRTARLGEVRRLEGELARAQGARPLPTTTFWRRIVQLEHAGYLRREIRTGGSGGTLSVVRLLTPVDEWVTSSRPSESRRADARWDDRVGAAPPGPGSAGPLGRSPTSPVPVAL